MHHEPLDAVPLWLLLVLSCLLSGAALETGYRWGRLRRRHAPESEAPVGAIVGSVLALFAFLLAFVFSSAGARYEARRQAVLDEANAIGTTYLRAQMLHEPQRGASMKLLREYVDVRVQGVREGKVEALIARSEQMQAELWEEAKKETATNSTPVAALYVQSLNEMIDIHSTRVQVAITNRVPSTIWLGLFALSFLSMASVGYQAGIAGSRRSPVKAVLVLAFAGTLFLIADLDRPGNGFITVSQDAMISLQTQVNAPLR